MAAETPAETTEYDAYPNVPHWQQDVVRRWGACLNNTGGNDPIELLERFYSEKYLLSTNMPVYLLAFGVHVQSLLLRHLAANHTLDESKAGHEK